MKAPGTDGWAAFKVAERAQLQRLGHGQLQLLQPGSRHLCRERRTTALGGAHARIDWSQAGRCDVRADCEGGRELLEPGDVTLTRAP